MRKFIFFLAMLLPLGAAAQSPAAPPPLRTELELVAVLAHGTLQTQKPGSPTLKYEIGKAGAGQGPQGGVEISKTGFCRYEAKVSFTTKDARFDVWGQFDFTGKVTMRSSTESDGEVRFEIAQGPGSILNVIVVRTLKDGAFDDFFISTEREDEWSLEIEPGVTTLTVPAYIAAGKDFAARFCPGFQPPAP